MRNAAKNSSVQEGYLYHPSFSHSLLLAGLALREYSLSVLF
jgi:hypothetical protein